MSFYQKFTVEQIRDIAKCQRKMGVYTPENGEFSPLTWVWVGGYIGQDIKGPVLGVILDISRTWNRNNLQKVYIVATTEGQFTVSRENLIPASYEDARNVAGLSLQEEVTATVLEAIAYGPSDANTSRYISAAYRLTQQGEYTVSVPIGNQILIISTDYQNLPSVILNGILES